MSSMPDAKYYVVTSEQMECHAKSKLNSFGYEITVLQL